eukprot:14532394-Alexandrium_andersonii.AAC.1
MASPWARTANDAASAAARVQQVNHRRTNCALESAEQRWEALKCAWNGLPQAAGGRFMRCSALSSAFQRCPVCFCFA